MQEYASNNLKKNVFTEAATPEVEEPVKKKKKKKGGEWKWSDRFLSSYFPIISAGSLTFLFPTVLQGTTDA